MSKSLPSLLLLPPPPTSVTPASLSAAYRPTITAVVSKLKALTTSTQLLIALPCPSVHDRLRLPRANVYDELQALLAGVYSLVCIVCANQGADVESDTPGSIDSRVLLLDFSASREGSANDDVILDPMITGPIIDLSILAITRRRWNLIFSVDGEAGQKLLANYVGLANRQSPPIIGHMETIVGGVSLTQKMPAKAVRSASSAHQIVAVGGTFDHLHAGHKLLLTATALLLQPAQRGDKLNRRLIVGITGDELLKNKKHAEYLKSWKQRQDDVVDFLLSVLLFTSSPLSDALETLSVDEPAPNGRAIHTTLKACNVTIECVEIQDPFGPTITDESITALVVSGETRSGGQAVNDKRQEKGWSSLEVFEIDVLDADESNGHGNIDNFASKISSSEIRKRKADIARSSSL